MATTVVVQPAMASTPMQIECPNCHSQVTTEMTPVSGGLAYLICIVSLLFGCWLGCCLIPFCVDGCRDMEHRCPSCKHFLGKYKRL